MTFLKKKLKGSVLLEMTIYFTLYCLMIGACAKVYTYCDKQMKLQTCFYCVNDAYMQKSFSKSGEIEAKYKNGTVF